VVLAYKKKKKKSARACSVGMVSKAVPLRPCCCCAFTILIIHKKVRHPVVQLYTAACVAGSVGSLHIPGRTFPVEQFFLEDLVEARLQAALLQGSPSIATANATAAQPSSSTSFGGRPAGDKKQQVPLGDQEDEMKPSGSCEAMPEGARLATARRGGRGSSGGGAGGGVASAAAAGGGGSGPPEQNQYQLQMLKGYQVSRALGWRLSPAFTPFLHPCSYVVHR
jgi:hypothetical protein